MALHALVGFCKADSPGAEGKGEGSGSNSLATRLF